MSAFLVIIITLLFSFSSLPYALAANSSDSDEVASGYNTIMDENNNVILQLGLTLHVGDKYINEDNNLYEITLIEGSLAKAHFVKAESSLSLRTISIPVQGTPAGYQPLIAIYHTHNDESYIPTDTVATEPGKGSIMLVGDSLSNRLNELGYQTEHDKTLHEPHDANAYQRSRRTFMRLLERQPAALFDIHRDSAPLTYYQTTINGEDTARILLVVGQQNQNHETTLQYAKTIKANADATYQGLIRGIFIAHGNYNQDLNPHSMLVEVGTQYNTREAAQRSAALFADVIPSIISPNPMTAAPSPAAVSDAENSPSTTDTAQEIVTNAVSEENKAALYDIFSIVGAVLVSTIAYLYLSTGSWQEAKNKLYKFYKYEFTNFLGPRRKRKD
jgi:stage II sporulation protein P